MAPYVALMQPGISNIKKAFNEAQFKKYQAIILPLNHNGLPYEFDRESLACKQHDNAFPDLMLSGADWNRGIIAKISENIDCDAQQINIRTHSERILLSEFKQAEYLLSGGYVMLRLKSAAITNLARLVASHCKSGTILIQVPAYDSRAFQASFRRDIAANPDADFTGNSWHWWNKFRCINDFNPKIKVVIEINPEVPIPDDDLRRWLGEPVEAVLLPASIFKLNRRNTPVLDERWTSTIQTFVSADVSFIISTTANDNNTGKYAEYLISMRKEQLPLVAGGYDDLLEMPLQPLYDNLNCYTYEVFEQDPTKYALYQRAIAAALTDRVSEEESMYKISIIMVLGAGRGPLVRSVLNASAETKRMVRIYIIEKNPNAIKALKNLKEKMWSNQDVFVIAEDMRRWTPKEKADILVSELLGSFGDNELSPECLDCAKHLLKPDGISIPRESTSFINPMMSSKLYSAARNINRSQQLGLDKSFLNPMTPESGYVVMLKNVFNLDFPQPLFKFHHPNFDEKPDNTRFVLLEFTASADAIVHGIAGYFEAILYDDIKLSINPVTHTDHMQSWFPMFFPITRPVHVKKGDKIEIHFWRCTDSRKVWYEWCLSKPIQTHIHNLSGRSYPIWL